MKTFTERDFITYPRQFKAYKWYKPILAGLLLLLFIPFREHLYILFLQKSFLGGREICNLDSQILHIILEQGKAILGFLIFMEIFLTVL